MDQSISSEMTEASFIPRAPWWGGDLQTLRNTLIRLRPDLSRWPGERVVLPLNDGTGDRLSAMLHRPAEAPRGPLIVLIHGLTGWEDSAYIRASAAHHLAQGFRVLRLNLRGAGPSRPMCRFQYHAGRAEDLAYALTAFAASMPDEMRDGVVPVGYSLGGNMLLRFLAEHAASFPVGRAAVVSAPIDLAACARRLLERRNRVYHNNLLAGMRRESTAEGAELTKRELRAIAAARTVVEFDDTFVAPRNGYADADEYYTLLSGRRFLKDVRVDTLIVHARNDPWIPFRAYAGVDWRALPQFTALFPEGGGHVGFHGRGSKTAWHDLQIGRFVEQLA